MSQLYMRERESLLISRPKCSLFCLFAKKTRTVSLSFLSLFWTGYTKITNMKLCYLDMNDDKLCTNKEVKKKFL